MTKQTWGQSKSLTLTHHPRRGGQRPHPLGQERHGEAAEQRGHQHAEPQECDQPAGLRQHHPVHGDEGEHQGQGQDDVQPELDESLLVLLAPELHLEPGLEPEPRKSALKLFRNR